MNNVGYIYRITNKIDGKFYIGKSKYGVQNRWLRHQDHFAKYVQQDKNSSRLYNAIKKHGIENFEIEEIDRCSFDVLSDRERYWIAKLDARNPSIGYNICKGGEGGPGGPQFAGHKHSDETKALMSLNRSGEKNSNYGNHRVMPEEEKQKHANPGAKNGMYGKKHSEESKQANREKHLGKIWVTNGDEDLHIEPEDLQLHILAGYRRGRTFARGRT